MSASIHDFPDDGVLYAIEDNYGADGYADVQDVANVLGLENAASLGRRLGWMRRYKMVEKHKREQGRWKVSRQGGVAWQQAESALTEISQARGVEMDLLRRTITHYRNGKKR
jgi:hypothetical protein